MHTLIARPGRVALAILEAPVNLSRQSRHIAVLLLWAVGVVQKELHGVVDREVARRVLDAQRELGDAQQGKQSRLHYPQLSPQLSKWSVSVLK